VATGVPGSHKANWVLPERYRDLDKYIDENVRPIPAKAGDCIIFT
jgi:ectoine hydroxylase-related dioxygenase (phytanoyl-CoA dioxygenase family)